MPHVPPAPRPALLSTLPARRADRRLALAVVLVSAVVFGGVAPFAKVQLAPVWAFIPVYQSALVVNDVITAILLFGQFAILRSDGLLVLGSAYLFTAFMAAAHGLTFPGLFAPTGLLGAGPQTTAWLYMFWHTGFPLLVIAYAWLKGAGARRERPRVAIAACVAGSLAAALGATLWATAGHDTLPTIMRGHNYTPVMISVVSTVWGTSLLALIVLWRRRPHSVLDLWLMVVLCAWIFDIALAAVLNHGRFDVGFYAGRLYGLLAASFVLAVLLLENGLLYARLVETHQAERRERDRAELKSAELSAANRDLESFSYSVSHDLRAPLRAMDGFARMLDEDYGDRLDAEGRRLIGVVRKSSQRMGRLIDDLLAFSRLGRQPLRTEPVRLDELVKQVLEELQPAIEGRSIEFRLEPLGMAEADAALLRQVLTNLLANAIKFTRGRTPAVVEVGCHPGTDPAEPAVYYIRDNGAGFDMQYADKLFGVFQRMHSPEAYEGTGVGLAIVRRVIERHGGRVWADAAPDRGATFAFTLASGPGAEPTPRLLAG
jgi:signal transduction histidine kinase